MVFSTLESTNLEKVTVKSLDEIKREKEQRQLGVSAHQATRHDWLHAGGSAEDSGEDRNLFGKIPIELIQTFEIRVLSEKTRFVNLS